MIITENEKDIGEHSKSLVNETSGPIDLVGEVDRAVPKLVESLTELRLWFFIYSPSNLLYFLSLDLLC